MSIHHLVTNTMDPEKGLITATARPAPSSPASEHGNVPNAHTPLELFQLLVGIHTPSNLTQDHVDIGRGSKAKAGKPRGDNVGLYERARQQERSSRLAYLSTSFISNTLYMLQILLAATFTAMSSYKRAHPVTLTVLGACNTVLAG